MTKNLSAFAAALGETLLLYLRKLLAAVNPVRRLESRLDEELESIESDIAKLQKNIDELEIMFRGQIDTQPATIYRQRNRRANVG